MVRARKSEFIFHQQPLAESVERAKAVKHGLVLPLATTIIECASAGVASSDFSLFDYRKLRRPLYPFDA